MTAMTLEVVQGFILMQQRRSGRQITECFPTSQKRFVKYRPVQAAVIYSDVLVSSPRWGEKMVSLNKHHNMYKKNLDLSRGSTPFV